MLSNALALSILTVAGFITVYLKLPPKVRKIFQKYDLITDVATLLATYWFLGGTITALFAGALVGLFVSAMLHIVNHPNDFLYVYDFIDLLKNTMRKIHNSLNVYGESYRATRRVEPEFVDAEFN